MFNSGRKQMIRRTLRDVSDFLQRREARKVEIGLRRDSLIATAEYVRNCQLKRDVVSKLQRRLEHFPMVTGITGVPYNYPQMPLWSEHIMAEAISTARYFHQTLTTAHLANFISGASADSLDILTKTLTQVEFVSHAFNLALAERERKDQPRTLSEKTMLWLLGPVHFKEPDFALHLALARFQNKPVKASGGAEEARTSQMPLRVQMDIAMHSFPLAKTEIMRLQWPLANNTWIQLLHDSDISVRLEAATRVPSELERYAIPVLKRILVMGGTIFDWRTNESVNTANAVEKAVAERHIKSFTLETVQNYLLQN